MNLLRSLTFSLIFFTISCGSDDDQFNQNVNNEWLIPVEEVFDGGPGKDGIPSVDDPKFDDVDEIDFLSDDDLVIGMVHEGKAKAYPHPILDWHEIVNDEIDDLAYGLTYCPLTGTGIAWNRNINGKKTTFGVSGKLYNTNLIPFDRETDSYWSQMRLDCVNGELAGTSISTFDIVETSWATWKKAYPDSKVLNTDTGFSRNYDEYPYGDYIVNDSRLIFPVSITDTRLPGKERVLGLIGGINKRVYSIELFEEARVIEDQLNGSDIIVIGSKEDNYIVAFENSGLSDFAKVSDQLPVIVEDGLGNRITLSGEIVDGPNEGEKLTVVESYMGYFFAFGAFYEGIDVYED